MEAQMRWNMKREEDKQRKQEKSFDRKQHLVDQQEFKAGIQERDRERKAENAQKDIEESRDFQETKRAVRQAAKDEEINLNKDAYVESKENASYIVEQTKLLAAERAQTRIEDNLERYQLVAEYNLDQQQREKMEEREAQLAFEQQEMTHKMRQVKLERDRALECLEHLKNNQHRTVNSQNHMVAHISGRFDR